MFRNIVGLYLSWNDPRRAIAIKWIELATGQTGEEYAEALVKIIQPVDKM